MMNSFLLLLMAYLTFAKMDEEYPGLATELLNNMLRTLVEDTVGGIKDVFLSGLLVTPNIKAIQFILIFWAVALLLEFLLGKIETLLETLTGHVPNYNDNA